MLISAKEIIIKSIDLYKIHYKIFLQYMGILLIPTGIISVTTLFFGSFTQAFGTYGFGIILIIYLAILVASSLFSLLISLAFIRVLANTYNNQPNKAIREEIELSTKLILPAIIASILTTLAVLGGTILLIIPGIIFAIWFAFSIYSVAIDEKSGIESLHHSKSLVSGRWWEALWRLIAPAFVFGVILMILQWIITWPTGPIFGIFDTEGFAYIALSIIFTLIGIVISLLVTPLTTASSTILYLELKKIPVAMKHPIPSENIPNKPLLK